MIICTGLLSAPLVTAGVTGSVSDDMNPMEVDFNACDIFDKNTLYASDSGFVRKIKLKGRHHTQNISQVEYINGVRDNEFDQIQHSRARIQMSFDFANNLSFGFDANFSDGGGSSNNLVNNGDTFINNFQTINIQWKPSDDFYVIIGEDKQDITREDIQSSRFIKTVERAPIVNEIGQQRPWETQVGWITNGIEQRVGAWVYGAYDKGPEWVDFRANKGLSCNLTVPVNDDFDFHFDWNYVDNEGGRERSRGNAEVNTFGPAYEHAFALGIDYEKDRLKIISDFIYGANRERSGAYRGSEEIPAGIDTWEFYVMPSYKITENL